MTPDPMTGGGSAWKEDSDGFLKCQKHGDVVTDIGVDCPSCHEALIAKASQAERLAKALFNLADAIDHPEARSDGEWFGSIIPAWEKAIEALKSWDEIKVEEKNGL